MSRRATASGLGAAIAGLALLASGCCDQVCECPELYPKADASVFGDAEAGPARAVGAAAANNSPRIDTLQAAIKGCTGAYLLQTMELSDPDGDDVTLTYRVAAAPQGASVRITPAAPLLRASGASVEIGVSSDLPGDVRVEYSVTDARGLASSSPYAAVYHFYNCPQGATPDAAPAGDAGP